MYDRLKRVADVLLALLLLVLFLPVVVLIAALIAAESGRPVLFRQTRIGRHGAPFVIVKFRTLRAGTHNPGDPSARVTRIGRVLRRWGLDEAPQLWNVLRGDMSLVGPRPTLPDQVAAYGTFEQRRLDVPPGLTGWAQIHGRNALAWPERIRLDVWYAEHRSLRLDVYILCKTPMLLITGKGVYGPDGRNPDFPDPSETPLLPLGSDEP